MFKPTFGFKKEEEKEEYTSINNPFKEVKFY